MAIWKADIKRQTNIPETVISKVLKALEAKDLVKEVVNFQHKRGKHYIAAEFEPSMEITGGFWYVNGELNKKLVTQYKETCLNIIRTLKVAAVEDVSESSKFPTKAVSEILVYMELGKEIIEVTSTGLGKFCSIPKGRPCYRLATGRDLTQGAMASIPCGVCPRVSQCTPDGIISPRNCEYYQKWLANSAF